MMRALRKASAVPVLAIVVLLVLLEPTLVLVLAKVLWAVAAGWIPASVRLAPSLEKHWSVLLIWTFGLLLAFVGTHLFLRELRRKWPLRWSVAMFGVTWLALLASMALIGVAHQLAWMMASKVPLVIPAGNRRLVIHGGQLRARAKAVAWKQTELRKILADRQRPMWEDFNVVLLSDREGLVTNIFVVDHLTRSGFVEMSPTDFSKVKPIETLQARLKGLEK